MSRTRSRKTTDALEILDKRYFLQPGSMAELAEAEASAEVARLIRAVRTAAGLTQRALAERIGTRHSVISRLENDDYEGHSLGMLRRIAAAVGKQVRIRFVPLADTDQD